MGTSVPTLWEHNPTAKAGGGNSERLGLQTGTQSVNVNVEYHTEAGPNPASRPKTKCSQEREYVRQPDNRPNYRGPLDLTTQGPTPLTSARKKVLSRSQIILVKCPLMS
jgi:hypothetical protein